MIEPAYKPSMKIVLHSHQAGVYMIFGGIYDLNHRKDFWEDNVGITPLVVKQSTLREHDFDVEFESSPTPAIVNGWLIQ